MRADNEQYLIFVFQQKEEYSDWATDPELKGKVLPLRDSDFKICAFQEAKGITHRHHVHTFFDDFGLSFGRMYATRLGEDLEEKRSKRLPKGLNLPWALFEEELEKFRPGPGYVENRYRESMIYASRNFSHCFGDIFDYYQSDMLDRIYDWSGLVPITVNVPIASSTAFVTMFIRYFQQKSRVIFESGGISKPIIYIIEDATILTDEKELGGATSPLVHMSFISRIYNQGFIFVGHSISASFNKKLLPNLELLAIFGIYEPTRTIQDLLICSKPQAQMASILKPSEFISLIPSFHPQAIYGRYPFIQPPRKLSETERQDIVGPFLDKVEAVKYITRGLPAVTLISVDSGKTRRSYRLSPIELQSLVIAGTGKRLIKTQLYEQLRSNRRDGKKVYDNLEKKGLVRTRTFGRTAFVEVLELGWKILEAKGFKRKKSRVLDGFDHTVGVDLVEETEKRKGNSVTFELDLFENRLDVNSLNRSTGQHTFFNIGVTDPAREAKNIIKILKLPIVQSNQFVFVARDAKFAKEVEKILKSKGQDRNLLKQLEIKVITDFIKT